jgi:hypothetical protein
MVVSVTIYIRSLADLAGLQGSKTIDQSFRVLLHAIIVRHANRRPKPLTGVPECGTIRHCANPLDVEDQSDTAVAKNRGSRNTRYRLRIFRKAFHHNLLLANQLVDHQPGFRAIFRFDDDHQRFPRFRYRARHVENAMKRDKANEFTPDSHDLRATRDGADLARVWADAFNNARKRKDVLLIANSDEHAIQDCKG